MSWQGSSTDLDEVVMPDLAGRRILIVEDSPVVGPYTADILTELGCEPIGPAPNMATARELAETEDLDAAIMDVHIRGERVFSLCDTLEGKGVPFLLTSGYADWELPDKWRDCPRLQKPYKLEQLKVSLAQLLRD